jgi:hypothetical protein
VPVVVCVSGLSILDCTFSVLCCVLVLFLFVLCLVPVVVCVSGLSILDCTFSVLYCVLVLFLFVLCLVPVVVCVAIKNGQSRDTDNNGHKTQNE